MIKIELYAKDPKTGKPIIYTTEEVSYVGELVVFVDKFDNKLAYNTKEIKRVVD